MDRKMLSVILLGFGFMLVFTAFQTVGNLEQTILNSIAEDDPSFSAEGYTSLAIIYGTLAVFNWMAPSLITFTGPRGAMFVGALTYLYYRIGEDWLQGLLSRVKKSSVTLGDDDGVSTTSNI